MNISRISMANFSTNFKGENKMPQQTEEKPLIDTTGVSDDTIVAYGTWGSNYAYPIYAGQLKDKQPALGKPQEEQQAPVMRDETPEEYYKRKLYSTEWCM